MATGLEGELRSILRYHRVSDEVIMGALTCAQTSSCLTQEDGIKSIWTYFKSQLHPTVFNAVKSHLFNPEEQAMCEAATRIACATLITEIKLSSILSHAPLAQNLAIFIATRFAMLRADTEEPSNDFINDSMLMWGKKRNLKVVFDTYYPLNTHLLSSLSTNSGFKAAFKTGYISLCAENSNMSSEAALKAAYLGMIEEPRARVGEVVVYDMPLKDFFDAMLM